MKLIEVWGKYKDCTGGNDYLSILVSDHSEGEYEKLVSTGTYNALGGQCDCCRAIDPKRAVVHKIVDLFSMEVLYRKEGEE